MSTDLDFTTSPFLRNCLAPSNMPCIIPGIPAKTNTLAILKPGALLTGFSMSSDPTGIFVIFIRASVSSPSL